MKVSSTLAAIFTGCLLANSGFAKIPVSLKQQETPFVGGYASIVLVVNSTQFGINNSSSFASVGIASVKSTSAQKQKENALSGLGEFAIGYGTIFSNNFYLGIEGYLALANHKTSNNLNIVDAIPSKIADLKSYSKQLNSLTGGLAIEPGFLVSPKTLFFGILGWDNATEKLTNNQSVNITTAASGTQSADNRNHLNGIKIGVGFRQQINQRLSLGVRYAYIDYFNDGGLNSGVANTTGVNLTGPFNYNLGKQKVSRQTLSANIIYHLDKKENVMGSDTVSEQGFKGFYIAPSIGLSSSSQYENMTNVSSNFLSNGAAPNLIRLTGGQARSAATLFNLAVGTGKIFSNHLYLGLEGSLSKDSLDLNGSIIHGFRPTSAPKVGQVPDVLTHQSSISSWALQPNVDLKVGYSSNQILGYLVAGIGVNNIGLENSSSLIFFNANNVQQTFTINSSDLKGTKANVRLGIGFEYQFSENNTFSLNYRYTYYGKFNIAKTLNTTDGAGNAVSLSDSSQLRLSNNSLTLGYSHYFDKV